MTTPIPGTSSVEYWDVDGVSLHKHGWSVKTIGGSRYGVPPMRGANQIYAFVPGQDFRPKQPDSRTITLAMWMQGVNPDTATNPACYPMEVQWNENWQFLRSLFWTPRREINLTRRWQRVDADGQIYIQKATAKAQLASDLQLTMTGSRTHAEFQVDLLLADPFFYGDEIELEGKIGLGLNHFNPGDYDSFHKNIEVEFYGPLAAPHLGNASFNPNVVMYLRTSVAANERVVFDIPGFTATSNINRADYGYSRLPFTDSIGSRSWMGVRKGNNLFTFYDSLGTGGWRIRYRPAYI